jgi:hypothetical protein
LLTRLCGHDTVTRWHGLVDEDRMQDLATDLIQRHYDPAYARSRRKEARPLLATVTADRLDAEGLADLADRVAALLRDVDLAGPGRHSADLG